MGVARFRCIVRLPVRKVFYRLRKNLYIWIN